MADNRSFEFTEEAKVFEKIVESRRSIRLFEKEPVPEAVIRHSLDMALLAPNSSNLQCWEFYWVRTPAKKAELVKACLSQAAASTAAELIVCVARTQTWKRVCKDMLFQMDEHRKKGARISKAAQHYYEKLVPIVYTQGPLGLFGLLKRIGFFIVGLRKPIGREPASCHHMDLWAVKSTALGCENLMLALRAHGYDSCPMEGMDSRRVRKLLKLPGDAIVTMVLAVGKRRPEGVTIPRIREERSLHVKEV